LSVIACYFNYDSPRMNAQRSPWAQPGVIALIAVIVAINLVVDWLWFRPTKGAAFIIVEAIVVGGIIALARWSVLRRRSRP
jgi:hypothetical protein